MSAFTAEPRDARGTRGAPGPEDCRRNAAAYAIACVVRPRQVKARRRVALGVRLKGRVMETEAGPSLPPY